MIETLQIIWNAPIGLQVIILGSLIYFVFHYYCKGTNDNKK